MSALSALSAQIPEPPWPLQAPVWADFGLQDQVSAVYELKEEFLFDQVPGFERLSRVYREFDTLGRLYRQEKQLILDSLNAYYQYDAEGRLESRCFIRQRLLRRDTLYICRHRYQGQVEIQTFFNLKDEALARLSLERNAQGQLLELYFEVLSPLGFNLPYNSRLYPKAHNERYVWIYSPQGQNLGYWRYCNELRLGLFYPSASPQGSAQKAMPGWAGNACWGKNLGQVFRQSLSRQDRFRTKRQRIALLGQNLWASGEQPKLLIQKLDSQKLVKQYFHKHQRWEIAPQKDEKGRLLGLNALHIQRPYSDISPASSDLHDFSGSGTCQYWDYQADGRISRVQHWFWELSKDKKDLPKIHCLDRHFDSSRYRLNIWQQDWLGIRREADTLRDLNRDHPYQEQGTRQSIGDTLLLTRSQRFAEDEVRESWQLLSLPDGRPKELIHRRHRLDQDSLFKQRREFRNRQTWRYNAEQNLSEWQQLRWLPEQEAFFLYRRLRLEYHPTKDYLKARWFTDYQVVEDDVPGTFYAEEFRHEHESLNPWGWIEKRYTQHRSEFQEYDSQYLFEYEVDERGNWTVQTVWHEGKLLSRTSRRIQYYNGVR